MYKFNKLMFTLCLALGAVNAKGLQGFYLAADLGASYSNIDLTLDDGPNNPQLFKTKNNLAQPSLGLSVGYDYLYNNLLMMGLEFFADCNMGSRKEIGSYNLTVWSGKVKAKRKELGLGILAKLGTTLMQSTVLFAGLGLKCLKYKFNYQDSTPDLSFKFGKYKIKLVTQVGLHGLLGNSDSLGWRVLYSYVPRIKLHKAGSRRTDVMGIVNGTGSFAKAKVSEHSFKSGVFYRI